MTKISGLIVYEDINRMVYQLLEYYSYQI